MRCGPGPPWSGPSTGSAWAAPPDAARGSRGRCPRTHADASPWSRRRPRRIWIRPALRPGGVGLLRALLALTLLIVVTVLGLPLYLAGLGSVPPPPEHGTARGDLPIRVHLHE